MVDIFQVIIRIVQFFYLKFHYLRFCIMGMVIIIEYHAMNGYAGEY
jgi:hypothetical protein